MRHVSCQPSGRGRVKTLLIIGMLLIVGLPCFTMTGWVADGLNGRVATVVKEEYEVRTVQGKCEQQLARKHVCGYDTRGNRTESAWYNADGSLSSKHFFSYDARGNMTEVANYSTDGLFTGKNVYIYNSVNLMTESTCHDDRGTVFSRNVYAYDARGFMTEEANYKSNGSLSGKSVYIRDARGHKTEASWLNPDGSLSSKNVYRYDARGNKLEDTEFDAKGLIIGQRLWTYDHDAGGKVARLFCHNADGSLSGKSVFTRDSRGNVTEELKYERRPADGVAGLVLTGRTKNTYTYCQ